MTDKVTLTLQVDDAEPILRSAAYDAAKYSALLDYITRKTYDAPDRPTPDVRELWTKRYLAAKRKVEAFGVDYEPTSEEETLTVHYPYVGGKTKRRVVGGLVFNEIVGSKQDFDHPQPAYRREGHSMACIAAAARVVRKWQASLTSERIAA